MKVNESLRRTLTRLFGYLGISFRCPLLLKCLLILLNDLLLHAHGLIAEVQRAVEYTFVVHALRRRLSLWGFTQLVTHIRLVHAE